MVGEEGIEPSHLAVHDFESCAYTSSATRPHVRVKTGVLYYIFSLAHRGQGTDAGVVRQL